MKWNSIKGCNHWNCDHYIGYTNDLVVWIHCTQMRFLGRWESKPDANCCCISSFKTSHGGCAVFLLTRNIITVTSKQQPPSNANDVQQCLFHKLQSFCFVYENEEPKASMAAEIMKILAVVCHIISQSMCFLLVVAAVLYRRTSGSSSAPSELAKLQPFGKRWNFYQHSFDFNITWDAVGLISRDRHLSKIISMIQALEHCI